MKNLVFINIISLCNYNLKHYNDVLMFSISYIVVQRDQLERDGKVKCVPGDFGQSCVCGCHSEHHSFPIHYRAVPG